MSTSKLNYLVFILHMKSDFSMLENKTIYFYHKGYDKRKHIITVNLLKGILFSP